MAAEVTKSEQPLCFVIMPFHEPFNDYYEEIIKPAVHDAGLMPQRGDDILGAGAFMEDVVNGIIKSEFIVAELTGRNANVFYELGLAHGLGKRVIMLTQNADDVPSDLKSLKWIAYNTISPRWSAKLQQELTEVLKATMKGVDKKLLFPFIHPDNSLSVPSLFKSLSKISGTQKQLLDYIKEDQGLVNQRHIEKRFSLFPPAEIFYRLEYLRLLGFLVSNEAGKDSSGKAIYAYGLSNEAKNIYR